MAAPEPNPGSPESPAEPTIGAGIDFADPNSPLAPCYMQASGVAASAILAAVFVLLCYVPMWHTDVWGHLKFGQWVVANGRLPDHDPFCPFTEAAPGALRHGWLSQVVFYSIYHAGENLADGDHWQRMAGGVDLLRFGHALLLTLRCILLLLAFRRVSGSLPAACLALAVMLALSVGNIAVLRPQVFGELLFAAVLLALSRPVLSAAALVALPIGFAVWGNLHGSFATGFVLIAASAVGRALEVGLAAPERKFAAVFRDGQLLRLIGVLSASAAAVACLNPSGPAIFAEIMAMARHANVRAMDEWQPLQFASASGGHWAYLLLGGLLVGTFFCCQRRFSAQALVLIVVFGVQPLLHQRMLIWWLMVAPWLMVRCWPDCRLMSAMPWLGQASVPSFRKTLIAGALVFVACVWSIPTQWLLAGRPTPLQRSVSEGTPWQIAALLSDPAQEAGADLKPLATDLQQHYPQGFTGCIFASETLGDFLLWELAPAPPVFVYTHVHLFTEAQWRQCMEVRSGQPGWRGILDRNRVNLVVVEPERNLKLCNALREDKDWHVALDESNSAKRDPRNRLFVAIRRTGK